MMDMLEASVEETNHGLYAMIKMEVHLLHDRAMVRARASSVRKHGRRQRSEKRRLASAGHLVAHRPLVAPSPAASRPNPHRTADH